MIERYSRPEISSIWSDESRFEFWLKVEIAVLQARAEAGDIPFSVYESVKNEARFSVERINELEAELHHDVIAFITNVGEHIGENSRYFHQGMTSSDALDTALALQLKRSSAVLKKGIEKLLNALAEKAREHKHTPIAGRTHGVHAEPTTFGLKLAGFYAELERGLNRFKNAAREVECGKLSGSVGTYSLLGPEIERRVMEILELSPDPISNQIVQRDRHANYLNVIAVIGGTLERLALEIRHLARTEVGEVLEPFGKKQRGSSAMPHKKNPVICERICGMARLLRAYAMSAMENQALWHERDISHSSVERVILPDSAALLDYMLDKACAVIEGMSVFPERMKENMNLTGGLIHSQSVLNALLEKGLDRDRAYTLVQRCAMQSRSEDKPFKDVLLEDDEMRGFLNDAEIENALKTDLKYIDAVFQRLGI